MEFATIILVCQEQQCPEFGIEKPSLMKLADNGELPWVVCGVCQTNITPNPNEETNEPA